MPLRRLDPAERKVSERFAAMGCGVDTQETTEDPPGYDPRRQPQRQGQAAAEPRSRRKAGIESDDGELAFLREWRGGKGTRGEQVAKLGRRIGTKCGRERRAIAFRIGLGMGETDRVGMTWWSRTGPRIMSVAGGDVLQSPTAASAGAAAGNGPGD